jgi:hypothetical protein
MSGNTLIWRMCLYGFLKNLKFFEPFIVTVLLAWGVSLFRVGCLISVEKAVAYTCGLPMGYLADRLGLRKTLCSCFFAYIAAFILYYNGQRGFPILIAAAACYGLGEALRSGVHKAIVFKWLETHDLLKLKSYLNGRTRSFSLLGSATSSIAAIFIALYVKEGRSIFLFSIVPYLLDALVIWSYPAYLDGAEPVASPPRVGSTEVAAGGDSEVQLKKTKVQTKAERSIGADAGALCAVLTNGPACRALLSATSFGSVHRLLKDYIQPVILVGGLRVAAELGAQAWGAHRARIVILGVAYGAFYLASTPASRSAYLVAKHCCREKWSMDALVEVYAGVLLACAAALHYELYALVIALYVALYVAYNLFKPISASAVSDLAGKELRASLFSADALLQTACVAALAPILGHIADAHSLTAVFTCVGGGLLVVNHVFLAESSVAALIAGCCCASSATTEKDAATDEEVAALNSDDAEVPPYGAAGDTEEEAVGSRAAAAAT